MWRNDKLERKFVSMKNPYIFLLALSILVTVNLLFSVHVYANDGAIHVDGLKYEFEKNGKYELEKSEGKGILGGESTYGSFSVAGNIESIDSLEGISVYGVSEGNLTFTYSYTDKLLKAPEEEWHLVNDSGKKINGIALNDKISKGAIVIQTSLDGQKWVDTYSATNVFEETPIQTKEFYTTTEVQLKNQCYYRIYIVYELAKKTGKKTEYKKNAEVYNFYAYDIILL